MLFSKQSQFCFRLLEKYIWTVPSWSNMALIKQSYLTDYVVWSIFNVLHDSKSHKADDHMFRDYTIVDSDLEQDPGTTTSDNPWIFL